MLPFSFYLCIVYFCLSVITCFTLSGGSAAHIHRKFANMDSVGRQLLQEPTGDKTAAFFGFMGATAAIVFTCEWVARQKLSWMLFLGFILN